MKFTQTDTGAGHWIQGYEAGSILINGRAYRESLIVAPERIVTGWGPESAQDLAPEHLDALIAFDPAVIVLGTGLRQVFPDPQVCLSALRRGLGVEVMDTGAACRTYGVLMAEGRKVVAGLIL